MGKKEPSGVVSLVAGAAGGVSEALSVQPFDMVKTRYQISTTPNPPVFTALRSIVREEGFLRLYRGLLPEAASLVPKSSAMYATYAMTLKKLEQWSGVESSVNAAVAGAVSGVSEALVVQPGQVIKVRLQSKAYVGKYRNTFHAAGAIFREEGFGAFGRGLGATLWRNCVWNTVYFALMYRIKHMLPTPESPLVDAAETLISGFFGGIIATAFNAPFDAAKSRIQQELLVAGQVPRFRTTWGTLALVYRSEGIRACYKGFAPKAIRMGIGGAVCMATFEAVCFVCG